jgi:hypothetical protein
MGSGHRLVNEASDLNRQVPRQRQRNSSTQTQGELTTVADRPNAVSHEIGGGHPKLSLPHTPAKDLIQFWLLGDLQLFDQWLELICVAF